MALTSLRNRDWLRWHFLVRVAGLTGLLVAGVGLVFWLDLGFTWAGVSLTVLGGLAAGFALVEEVRNATEFVAARRGAAGSNAVAQIALAVVLLVEVNAFAFFHYHRFDWTRGREFTIPAEVQDQLSQLRGRTTIAVHVKRKFGQLSGDRDKYDDAAERLVIDKIEDVVEQFREFGPQFRVVVLDIDDDQYQDKLKKLGKESRELADAIEKNKEDSVFIQSGKKVQRIPFQDIYQLDKKASQKANEGNGNLVMHYQGVGALARRILNLDEKKPRVALGVIHEELSTEGDPEMGLAMGGLKKALGAHGIETEDILLKKWNPNSPPEPAVLTFDENRYEGLESQVASADRAIKGLKDMLRDWNRRVRRFENATGKSLKKLNKEFGEQVASQFGINLKELDQLIAEELRVEKVGDKERARFFRLILERSVAARERQLKREEQEKEAVLQQQRKLNVVNLAEQRRISDLRAKLGRKLADCDLLILPRMTVFNAAKGERIRDALYHLDQAQVEAIKDFMKKGKPVLFCFGPPSEPARMPQDFMHGRSDGVDEMLRQLGIRLGPETILFTVETKSYAQRRGIFLIPGIPVEVPPVKFEWEPGSRAGVGGLSVYREAKPNPIAESMRLAVASVGNSENLDLRLRNPRPVSFEPPGGKKLARDPVFLMTDPDGWKEPNPFPSEGKTPQPDFTRTGQFPIGVAVEVPLPSTWGAGKDKVRVVAIGHGGVFMGNQLSPVREKLLLDVSNWLLGRDDLLSRNIGRWEYPRVALSDTGRKAWLWSMRVWLPLAFFLLGLVVLLKRRLR